jgi:hypothetical protein
MVSIIFFIIINVVSEQFVRISTNFTSSEINNYINALKKLELITIKKKIQNLRSKAIFR